MKLRLALLGCVTVVVCVVASNIIVLNRKSAPRVAQVVSKLYGWGWGINSALSSGQSIDSYGPSPISIPAGTILSIAAGGLYSGVVTGSGEAFVWQSNQGMSGGQSNASWMKKVAEIPAAKQVAIGRTHFIGLDQSGQVWSWGTNVSGQLGQGNNISSERPVQVKNLDRIDQISAGYKFSVALDHDGSVWAWGGHCDSIVRNEAVSWWEEMAANVGATSDGYYDPTGHDMLEYDDREDCVNEDIVGIKSKVPIQLVQYKHIVQVSSGYGHFLMLDDSGSVWGQGCSTYKQVGPRSNFEGLPKAREVAAGFRHSLVLTQDGEVYAWGHNEFGELGRGRASNFETEPAKVVGLPKISQIAAGRDFSAAIDTEGYIWTWGKNDYGQLGIHSFDHQSTPVRGLEANQVTSLVAGGGHMLVLEK